MSVSEPKLMGRTNGDADSQTSQDDSGEESLDTDEFEQLLVCANVYVSCKVAEVRVGRSRLERASAPGNVSAFWGQETVPFRATQIVQDRPSEITLARNTAFIFCYIRPF
jgi:hypothetical protein